MGLLGFDTELQLEVRRVSSLKLSSETWLHSYAVYITGHGIHYGDVMTYDTYEEALERAKRIQSNLPGLFTII